MYKMLLLFRPTPEESVSALGFMPTGANDTLTEMQQRSAEEQQNPSTIKETSMRP